jgi:hypothetical protein
MIALSRKTQYSHVVYCATEADASTLFDRAQAGDTLHNVGVTEDATALMNQIGSQLQQGKYKQI